MATTLTTAGPFVNEPITDYRQPENVRGMRQAIEKVRAQLGREYDLVIGGKPVRTSDKIVSVNPANPSEVIGIHQKAGLEHVEPAMQAALAAFQKWRYASVEERTGVLFRTAETLRRRKFEFNAWLVLEVGKNYDEAEADTAEAIDFLELYARQALVEFQEIDGFGRVGFGFVVVLADFQHQPRVEFELAPAQRLRRAEQYPGALFHRSVPPFLKSRQRRLHGWFHVFQASLLVDADHFRRIRRVDGNNLVGGADRFAANHQIVLAAQLRADLFNGLAHAADVLRLAIIGDRLVHKRPCGG